MKAEIEKRLRQEWFFEKNKVSFEEGLKNKDLYAAWKCEKGHEWSAKIKYRIYKDQKCPFCSGRRPVIGENDVCTIFPILREEFHPTKNGDLRLEDYKQDSGIMVWWRCKKGHEWQDSIRSKTRKGGKCPKCLGIKTRVVSGVNDFATLHPQIAKELDPCNNKEIDITKLACKSHLKMFWRCSEGHVYEMSVKKRTERGSGCPYCAGRYAVDGETDLLTVMPELAMEWDVEANKPLRPSDLKPMSNKKVWWRCPTNHLYRAKISERAKGHGCPYCAGKHSIIGVNDLATACPELVEEWDYSSNDIPPECYTAGSSKKVNWICPEGHKWAARIKDRVGGTKCPYCSRKRAVKGENDLKTLFPEIAAEWDFGKNKKRLEDVCVFSNVHANWQCKHGHQWNATVYSRTTDGNGCPYCSGKRAIRGETDLASLNPELAEEWNYKMNRMMPFEVTARSSRRVFWICKYGHSWKASIDKRANGTGCPICYKLSKGMMNR